MRLKILPNKGFSALLTEEEVYNFDPTNEELNEHPYPVFCIVPNKYKKLSLDEVILLSEGTEIEFFYVPQGAFYTGTWEKWNKNLADIKLSKELGTENKLYRIKINEKQPV